MDRSRTTCIGRRTARVGLSITIIKLILSSLSFGGVSARPHETIRRSNILASNGTEREKHAANAKWIGPPKSDLEHQSALASSVVWENPSKQNDARTKLDQEKRDFMALQTEDVGASHNTGLQRKIGSSHPTQSSGLSASNQTPRNTQNLEGDSTAPELRQASSAAVPEIAAQGHLRNANTSPEARGLYTFGYSTHKDDEDEEEEHEEEEEFEDQETSSPIDELEETAISEEDDFYGSDPVSTSGTSGGTINSLSKPEGTTTGTVIPVSGTQNPGVLPVGGHPSTVPTQAKATSSPVSGPTQRPGGSRDPTGGAQTAGGLAGAVTSNPATGVSGSTNATGVATSGTIPSAAGTATLEPGMLDFDSSRKPTLEPASSAFQNTAISSALATQPPTGAQAADPTKHPIPTTATPPSTVTPTGTTQGPVEEEPGSEVQTTEEAEAPEPTLPPTSLAEMSTSTEGEQGSSESPAVKEQPSSEETMEELEKEQEEEKEKEELLEEELDREEREVRRIGGFGVFLAIIAMIFTAHQMSENPDGIYASCCRLIITLVGCSFKVVLMPFRSAVGGNRGYGHLPVSTMDYGYRDPYRPGASNGGSMELS